MKINSLLSRLLKQPKSAMLQVGAGMCLLGSTLFLPTNGKKTLATSNDRPRVIDPRPYGRIG